MEAAAVPVSAKRKLCSELKKPTQPWEFMVSLPRAAGLLEDPVPVYFSFLVAVALIHLQALNAFPAAHMG